MIGKWPESTDPSFPISLIIWKNLKFENLNSFRFDLRPESARSGEPSAPSISPKVRTVVLRDIDIRAELLSCALIDTLRFVYEITDDDFPVVMAKASPALYERAVIGITRLLKLQEQDEIMDIAGAITEAFVRVANNHQSLITMKDRAYIITNVVEPARYLNIEPRYIIKQLYSLSIHLWHGANLKKTTLYTHTVSMWGRGRDLLPSSWLADKKATLLAKRLVSDDITVTNLNARIGDPLRTVLGTAIAAFGKQHCHIRSGSVEREIYTDTIPAALACEVQHWEAMARREKNETGYSTLPAPSKEPIVRKDIPPVPPLPSPIPRVRERPISTFPELSMGPELESWGAEAHRVTRGVRADDAQSDPRVQQCQAIIEAQEHPHLEESQSVLKHRPRAAAKLQRSTSMTLGSVQAEGREW
ncbi:hypothetical protein J1614_004380 [Plenodomus biglobosus]|nr:hypothetical protein J1614_004380 [Plenodomus biglobosus]